MIRNAKIKDSGNWGIGGREKRRRIRVEVRLFGEKEEGLQRGIRLRLERRFC